MPDKKPPTVFLSYSSRDKLAADALCARVEEAGIRCWIAPRDIIPGLRWGECIIRALDICPIMVLLMTHQSSASTHVAKEVERAVHKGVIILPLRIEDVQPQGNLEYFLSDTHWMDALTRLMEMHFDRLIDVLQSLIGTPPPKAPTATAVPTTPESREQFLQAFEEFDTDDWKVAKKDSWFRRIARVFDDV